MLVMPGDATDPYWNASCSGCTDPAAFNYDANATDEDGSCIAVLNGCTDPAADNYFAGANTDDGSCIYGGCTDPVSYTHLTLPTNREV